MTGNCGAIEMSGAEEGAEEELEFREGMLQGLKPALNLRRDCRD